MDCLGNERSDHKTGYVGNRLMFIYIYYIYIPLPVVQTVSSFFFATTVVARGRPHRVHQGKKSFRESYHVPTLAITADRRRPTGPPPAFKAFLNHLYLAGFARSVAFH